MYKYQKNYSKIFIDSSPTYYETQGNFVIFQTYQMLTQMVSQIKNYACQSAVQLNVIVFVFRSALLLYASSTLYQTLFQTRAYDLNQGLLLSQFVFLLNLVYFTQYFCCFGKSKRSTKQMNYCSIYFCNMIFELLSRTHFMEYLMK